MRARDFTTIMNTRSSSFKTRHLLVPFGDDFKFKNAERQFANMDRLMEAINKDTSNTYGGMKVQYSTLSDYFAAVSKESSQGQGVSFPVLTGDFFPYADNEDSYWTGYYTTRPQLKIQSRKLNQILRSCEVLLVVVRQSPHANWDTERRSLPREYWEAKFKAVEKARMETALMLHHDAITGTARSNVVADYIHRMESASQGLMDIMARMVEHLMTKEPNPPPTFTPDPIVFQPPEQAGVAEVVRDHRQTWRPSPC
jgi:alpha-mannosidase II